MRYEALHCHFEPGESSVNHHFQVDINEVTVHREPASPIHVVPAIDWLMNRYYERLDELEDRHG